MQYIEEWVHSGRNNPVTLDVSVLDPRTGIETPATVTRCQVLVGATLADSAVNPSWFDLTTPGTVKLLFGQANLPIGRHKASMYLFDTQNPLGIKWPDFILNVR